MGVSLFWTEQAERAYNSLEGSSQSRVKNRLDTVEGHITPEHFIEGHGGHSFEKIKVGRSGFRVFIKYMPEIDAIFILDIQPRNETTYRPRDVDLISATANELETEIEDLIEEMSLDAVKHALKRGELL